MKLFEPPGRRGLEDRPRTRDRRRAAQRGTSLVEALIAAALVALSALTLLRIQAVWTLAGQDASQQTHAARGLQSGIDAVLAPVAALVPASTTLPLPGPPGSLPWTLTRVPGPAADESATTWTGGWTRRDGSTRDWIVQGHEFRVSMAALARAHPVPAGAASAGGFVPGLLAPAGRPAAWDAGFDGVDLERVPGSAEQAPIERADDPRQVPAPPANEVVPLQPTPAVPCNRPMPGPPRVDAPPEACAAEAHMTRSGAIRWSPELLADPPSRAQLENWVAGLLEPTRNRDAASSADPRCAFRLEPGVDPYLAWRCLGQAWSTRPVDAVPVSRPETVEDWPAGMGDPLGGLPPGLRACRYADAAGSAGTDRTPAALAILQHRRVHWLVIPAARDCPAGTVPVGP
jgi:hypothetical protein